MPPKVKQETLDRMIAAIITNRRNYRYSSRELKVIVRTALEFARMSTQTIKEQ